MKITAFSRVALVTAGLSLFPAATEVACSSATATATGDVTVDAGAAAADASKIAPATDSGGQAPVTVEDSGPIMVDAGGPVCNALSVAAPSVPYSLSNDAVPTATGGTIADGTYYLTSYTIYGAGQVESGFTANQATSVTLVIAAGTWNEVQVYAIEGTTSTVTSTFTVTTTGAAISMAPSCPAGGTIDGTYTATSSAVQVISQSSGFTVSETFALQ